MIRKGSLVWYSYQWSLWGL